VSVSALAICHPSTTNKVPACWRETHFDLVIRRARPESNE
jgi:hypothetical protein